MNRGAFLKVDENLLCAFEVLDPIAYDADDFNERLGTPPRTGEPEAESTFTIPGGHTRECLYENVSE
jgi:hypothetical protein